MDVEAIREVYELSATAAFRPDLTLESTAPAEFEIVSRFESALARIT